MPCSDAGAWDYARDPRTENLISEINTLKKQVDDLSAEPGAVELQLHKDKAGEFALRLNNVTALLCKATHLLVQRAPDVFEKHADLQAWYELHTEEDVLRMKEELDKIVKRKNYTIRAFIKWYKGLSEKEQELFETRPEFTKYKVNPK